MPRKVYLAALQVGVPAVLVLLWWRWSESAGSIYFPPLSKIIEKFRENWMFDRVGTDVIPSLRRMFTGLAIAVVAGVFGGFVLGLLPRLHRAVSPVLEFVRVIPTPILTPAAIVIFGIGDSMKVWLIALGCVWPMLFATIAGVRGTDPLRIEMAKVYGLSAPQRIRVVYLPGLMPQFFAGLRTALPISLILMVVTEMVASTNGLGYFIIYTERMFSIADMWSGMLLMGLLGFTLNLCLERIERRVLRWHDRSRGATRPGRRQRNGLATTTKDG